MEPVKQKMTGGWLVGWLTNYFVLFHTCSQRFMKFNIFINGVRVTNKTTTNDKNVKGAKLKNEKYFSEIR